MSDKHEDHDDNPITFTLGKGNHSSICGGVTPMGIDALQNQVDAHPAGAENPVGVKGEPRPSAETNVRIPCSVRSGC
jgi:hypothetical protein